MPRRSSRRDRFETQAPREVTLIIAVILWLLGFADLVLNVISLPNNLGLWSMVAAGLLLILGSLVDGI